MKSYKGAIVPDNLYKLLTTVTDREERIKVMKNKKKLKTDLIKALSNPICGGYLLDDLGADIIFNLIENKEVVDRCQMEYNPADREPGSDTKYYTLYRGTLTGIKNVLFILEMECVSTNEKRYIIVKDILYGRGLQKMNINIALQQIYHGIDLHYRQGEVLVIPLGVVKSSTVTTELQQFDAVFPGEKAQTKYGFRKSLSSNSTIKYGIAIKES